MVRRASVWVVVGLGLALGGCNGTATIGSKFDATAASYITKPGTGRIYGEAFLRRDFGYLVTSAGERVFLIPATPYALERFAAMFGGDRRAYYGTAVDDPPAEYYDYRRETKVDMKGKFLFENVAPGRYIVATRAFWTEPKSFFTHGGAMYDIVDVKNDETATAIISGK